MLRTTNQEKINLLKQSGAKHLHIKEVDERIQHACNNDGILLVGMMEDDGIEDIAAATVRHSSTTLMMQQQKVLVRSISEHRCI